jgi:subtilisin family serine protease
VIGVRRQASPGWWVAACCIVALPLAAAAGASAQPGADQDATVVSGDLRGELSGLDRDEAITVIVTLRDQATVATPSTLPRRERLRRVISRLRDEASSTQGPIRSMLASAAQGQVRWVHPLWIFNGLVVRGTAPIVRRLAQRPEVASVDDNTVLVKTADAAPPDSQPEPNIALTGAPTLWAQGITGQGIVVANLDTGVDITHPDLANRWRGGTNSWFDPYGEHPATPTDVNGHGTQTMGVIVGGDAGGTAIGMAPGAQWISARIFNNQGGATTAAIHEAFQWVLDPDGDPATADAPNVVSNSWTFQNPGCDLTFQQDLHALRAGGILPVFAAGNSGPTPATDYSPANNPEAFAVGATDNADAIASDSSRGPSACGEQATTFPELSAPGVDVNTADLYGFWTTASGTSLAAAHGAGAVALLESAHPNLPVAQQELALEQGAMDLGDAGPDNAYGWGRLDVVGANDRLAPDFAISARPARVVVRRGQVASYEVTVGSINGFSDDVDLSVSGRPDRSRATFSRDPVTPPGASTLDVKTTAATPLGLHFLRVRGISGALRHVVRVRLVVRSAP